ncbi:MAG: hypothetical protein WAU88_01065 [Candidatus Zixiibacteriota bacterium]
MKRLILVIAISLFPTLVASQDFSLFDSAMAQVGLTGQDIRFDQDEMATWGGDQWRLTYFTMFHRNPLKLPKYGQMNLEAFTADCGNISALIANGGRKIDCPVRRGLVADQMGDFLAHPDPLSFSAYAKNHHLLEGAQFDKLKFGLDLLCALIDDSTFSLTKAYQSVDRAKSQQQVFSYFVSDGQQYNDEMEQLAGKVDLNRVIGGAEDISEALKRLADSSGSMTFPDKRIDLPMNQGLIVIGSTADDDYFFSSPPLLILDPGGNDTYAISGYSSAYPLSAIVDLAGNDHYLSADSSRPGIGGAVLGMSVVIDRSGDDRYDGVNVTQGCGMFGVGVVMDNNGNDTYRCKSNAQGCGVFGVGILSDSLGNDSLYCWSNAQGYGYTKGCGLCINYAGSDTYIAEDSIIFSPGQQTKEHNSSLAQGVGFGKRADYVDGHSWAGGVGILCDIKGDDKYRAGLFAQGCGYWFALGMLLDGDGNDDYLSTWYTLGSGAHFAIGYLDDFAGNDRYNATMNMSIGSGHDFTIGYFNERSGNDVYFIPGLSGGGGNFQGIGIFHDWNGDDIYNSSGRFMLGGAQGLLQGARAYLNTYGIFIDGGGKDSYKETWSRNGTLWIGPKSNPDKPNPYEIGVGIDR